MSKSAAAFRTVLSNHTAADIEMKGMVIEIPSTHSPLEAAQVLWDNNILGAPVWNEETKEYWGFLDMRDMTSAIVMANSNDNTFRSLDMTKWFDEQHVTVAHLAARNPFLSCQPTASLEAVSPHLTEHRCHRIPVMGTNGRCQSIITQSALVMLLAEHVVVDGDYSDEETLEEAHFDYKKDVLCANDTTCARHVFALLVSKELSGIAIVDEETGKLVGNTSARDIKLAVSAGVAAATLDMDILSYLAAVRQAVPTKNERYPSASVHEESTVGHAIRLLAKTGYHRVFVVDKDQKPVGVISVADIIRFVVG
jgi:CBS domain-containing protein